MIKGLSLDEDFAKADTDALTNATDLFKRNPACLAKISSFLPAAMTKVPFEQFGKALLQKLRVDYAVRKAAVEVDNMGLSKLAAGFDATDPFDENRGPRGLEFDSVNPATRFHLDPNHPGLTGNAALFYLFYLLDLPSQDFSTAISRGTNIRVDDRYVLSGSASLYYGNVPRCYAEDGTLKSRVKPYDTKQYRFSEGVEEFFGQYLPARFFVDEHGQPFDKKIDRMTCDELANKSRLAIEEFLK